MDFTGKWRATSVFELTARKQVVFSVISVNQNRAVIIWITPISLPLMTLFSAVAIACCREAFVPLAFPRGLTAL